MQQRMYAGAALKQSLSDLGWTQRKLAAAAGMPASQINRYIRGTRLNYDAAAKILRAFPEEQQAAILLGYLRDATPEGFHKLIVLAEANPRVREIEAFQLPDGLDAEGQKLLARFAELIMRHSEIRDMLKSFLAALEPRRS